MSEDYTVLQKMKHIENMLRRAGHDQGLFVSVINPPKDGPRPRLNSGGKVYPYERDSTRLKDVFQDEELCMPHPLPVLLDSDGSAEIYWSGEYTVRVTDSLDNPAETFQR